MHRPLQRDRRRGTASWIGVLLGLALCGACGSPPTAEAPSPSHPSELDTIAESYVRLVLAFAVHWPDYLDSYYGPEEWRTAAAEAARDLLEIRQEASALASRLGAMELPPDDETTELRRRFLVRHTESLVAAIDYHQGVRWTFDEESKAFFDAEAPRLSEDYFQEAIAELDRLLPGDGEVQERYRAYRERFVVPSDRLEAVYRAALDEAKRRTIEHIDLPDDERVDLELVESGNPGIYHAYKGNHRSVLELNVGLPDYIDAVPRAAAHEGYPGHHVQAVLIDADLLQARGWLEFNTLIPFSPFALIVEGAGNYAYEVAFPDPEDEARFLADVLFPLAGFDPADAELLMAVSVQRGKLSYPAAAEAARRYFDGDLDRKGAENWLVRYGLWSEDGAASAMDFIEEVRSFVINYSVGHQLVREHVEARGGTADDPQRRWAEFERLLRSPLVASTLDSKPAPP